MHVFSKAGHIPRVPYTKIIEDIVTRSAGKKGKYPIKGCFELLMRWGNNIDWNELMLEFKYNSEQFPDFDFEKNTYELYNGNTLDEKASNYIYNLLYRYCIQLHNNWNFINLKMLKDGDEGYLSTMPERIESQSVIVDESALRRETVRRFAGQLLTLSNIFGVDLFPFVEDYKKNAGNQIAQSQQSNCFYSIQSAQIRGCKLRVRMNDKGEFREKTHEYAIANHVYNSYDTVNRMFKRLDECMQYRDKFGEVRYLKNLNNIFTEIKHFLIAYNITWDIDSMFDERLEKWKIRDNNADKSLYIYEEEDIESLIGSLKSYYDTIISESGYSTMNRKDKLRRESISNILDNSYNSLVIDLIKNYCPYYKENSVISSGTYNIAMVDNKPAILCVSISTERDYVARLGCLSKAFRFGGEPGYDNEVAKIRRRCGSYIILTMDGLYAKLLFRDFKSVDYGTVINLK